MKTRLGVLVAALVHASAAGWAQMATADRMTAPGFWPTKGTPSRKDYVGAAACAACHPSIAATQSDTRMARTLRRAEDVELLRDPEPLEFAAAGHAYEMVRKGPQILLSVTDGSRSSSARLEWAFGFGKIGQTYLFEKDGVFHEARVSYYDALKGLDFTPARALATARDPEEAIARPVPLPEARRCFGCHTTASTTEGVFDLAASTPGVRCEACHGPGRPHLEAMQQGRVERARASILSPGKLGPADSVDFCGACHATFWDVKLAAEKGIAALRSQPHRLQSSRCWGGGDRRITCVACHDPHRPLARDAPGYDGRCLSCHARADAKPSREQTGRPCPVARQDCVSCHMPKYEVPEMHFRFTDHLIRVVRPRP
jgi:hypothetical protein